MYTVMYLIGVILLDPFLVLLLLSGKNKLLIFLPQIQLLSLSLESEEIFWAAKNLEIRQTPLQSSPPLYIWTFPMLQISSQHKEQYAIRCFVNLVRWWSSSLPYKANPLHCSEAFITNIRSTFLFLILFFLTPKYFVLGYSWLTMLW